MKIKSFVNAWMAAANQFDTNQYLSFFLPNAILDDPSVGRKFIGHTGIRNYFDSYFIGYNTQTRLVKMDIVTGDRVHLEVEFTGSFPEGTIGGVFDISFQNDRIVFMKADLIN